jgi:predicted transcriptional regulator of viral defense system
VFAYNWGVASLDVYVDEQLSRGRAYFSREEGMNALGLGLKAFSAAATRLTKKGRLARPWRGFYVVLRPEDRVIGAPDPARWIEPLMEHLGLDYRISLLRAAAFHGSSHQAAMVFQVIVPKQLREFVIGRHRIQFIYQSPSVFSKTNHPDWLEQMKTEAGFAKVAGVELTLLDSARYFHKAGGINGVAQVAHDLGGKCRPPKLAKAAAAYENSAVRRLGYLLDRFGHSRQANALEPFARKAKSAKPLDPSAKPLIPALAEQPEKDTKWMLTINEPVEIDM